MKKGKLLFFVLTFLFLFNTFERVYAFLPADGNRDNIVDGKDYTMWLNGYGKSQSSGDYDLNGFVDGKDYVIWLRDYGKTDTPVTSTFVTRERSDLYINGKQVRFVGANIFWLQLDSQNGQLVYPSQFRINDALYTVKEMGGNVVRTWANSVGCSLCIQPAKDKINPQAFQSLDYAVKIAKDNNLRLILTLTDNYAYFHGGKSVFSSWYGVPENQFYTNRSVIDAYKKYIYSVITHVNSFTQKAYKDDPTIMAWETGNELSWDMHFSPWTKEISDYIKSIAPQQLVIDGHYGVDSESLKLTNVDIFSNHYRTKSELTNESQYVSSSGKAYILGEYKWNGGRNESDDLGSYLNNIELSKTNIAIFWSLFSHDDTKGFVMHNDGYSMYYPGISADEINRTQMIRGHFFRMRNSSVILHSPPNSPLLQGTKNGTQVVLSWRGSPTSATYILERSSNQGTSWEVINSSLKDINPNITDIPPKFPVSYRLKGVTPDNVHGQYSTPISF